MPHVHLHLQPRHPGDGLLQIYHERPAYPSRAELDELAAAIRAGLVDAE